MFQGSKRLKCFKMAVVTSSIALLAGCGGNDEDRREYSLPTSLCDVEVDKSLYREIFPPGSRVDVQSNYEGSDTERMSPVGECFIEVDGELAVYVETVPGDGGHGADVEQYLAHYMGPSYDPAEGVKLPDGSRDTRVWGNFAAVSAACESSSIDIDSINISIRLDWVGDDDYSEQLADLIVPFADEQLRMIGERTCTPAPA